MVRLDDDDIMERAYRAYHRWGREQGYLPEQIQIPANTSSVRHHRGQRYAVLENVNGPLAVYRVQQDGSIRGLRHWPKALDEL